MPVSAGGGLEMYEVLEIANQLWTWFFHVLQKRSCTLKVNILNHRLASLPTHPGHGTTVTFHVKMLSGLFPVQSIIMRVKPLVEHVGRFSPENRHPSWLEFSGFCIA